MPQPELVIFDFDGTLVDTAPDIVRATNRFLEEQGFAALPEARIRAEIGNGLKRLLRDVYPRREGEPLPDESELYERFTQVYEQEYLKSPVAFEGAIEFLHDWPGQIAIVSNKRERFMRPILEKLGMHTLPWAAIVGGDTFTRMKPHPEPFLFAMNAAGTEPESTVVVGDGIPDVQGAVNVGSRCVAVEFGYTSPEFLMDLGAWRRLSTFHELAHLLASIH